jgi:iron complex outermembrane receptor protein
LGTVSPHCRPVPLRLQRACTAGLAAATLATALLPLLAQADSTLEEIVVTAQRRVERLQDVPLAITALSASDLADRGVRQAGDITASVPNMLLNLPYGPEAQPTFTLRGVTTQDYSQNQSSPIAMYVDEVYKAVGAVQALQTYDLDRVEVLRGPQGTLYGKNATGGAVSFYTKNPSLANYDGYASAGIGDYGAYSLNAAVGGPILDNQLGVRAAVLYEKRDGWVHSIVPGVEPLNGVDALAGRLSFLYKGSDSLTATLKLSVSRSGGTPYGAHALNADPIATGFSGTIDWFDNGAKYAVHKDLRNDSVALKIEWLASEHTTLTSVTGFDYGRWYTKSDDGGLPITARLDDPNTYYSSTNDFSQELRLASRDTGAFGWLAGLYYGRESTHATVEYHFFDSYALGYFALPDGTPLYGFDEYNSFDQLKDSKAVFLNTTFALNPAFTLHAGARYTRDQVSINNFYALEGGPLAPGPTGFTPDGGVMAYWTQTIGALPATFTNYQTGTAPQGPLLNLSQDNNNVSFRLGVDWKPSQGVLAYLNVSQGYRGAAFNGQAFNFPQEANFADPEKLTSVEIGLKADLWNRRGTFNAAVFHYDYKNQQFLDAFTLPGGAGSGFHTINAPKSRVDGAEFELRAKATDDLEIRAGLGLMHSKYVELSLHAAARVCCVGNQLIQAPDYNASLGIDWRFARLSAGDLRLMVDGNYYAKQYFDAFNTERISQSAYGIANARVSYKSAAKRGFDAGAWVKNLTNRRYIAYGLNQNDPDTGAIGFDYGLVGEPRTYGADVTYRF